MSTCDGIFDKALKLLDDEQFPEAIQAFTDFIALCPESEGAYGNRGIARMHTGDDVGALSDFRMVVELNPDDAQGYAMAAEALRNLGKYEEALTLISESLEIEDDEPNAHLLRGWLFFRGEQYEYAAEDIQIYVDEADEPSEAVDMLRVCRVLSGLDTEEGVDPTDAEDRQLFLDDMSFSFDFTYNDEYEASGLFCGYAHCLRNMPRRAEGSACCCVIAGFECPGGEEQICRCRLSPPKDF